MKYDTSNGAKPRYDNAGTEFGRMHRDLGVGYWMFDVDRIYATIESDLQMKKENECFIEYRQRMKTVNFTAMFEVKHKKSDSALQQLDQENSIALARREMARRLECRLFIVFADDGEQPFEFYEINTETGGYEYVGTLTYDKKTRFQEVRVFWQDVLGIQARYFD